MADASAEAAVGSEQVRGAAQATEAEAGHVQYVPGQGGDFGSLEDSSGGEGSAGGGVAAQGGKSSGGGEAWGLLRNAWSVTQKLAKDVGVNDALKDMKLQVNKMKASQMGASLQLIETVEEAEEAIRYIRESRDRYNQLLSFLSDMAAENVRAAPALRRAGAAFIRCATISDKVAREMATSGKEGFYKEVPTYQSDLTEALMVTSGALMYQADRVQGMYTTSTHLGASVHTFEQGTYSNKYYTASDKLGPGALNAAIETIKGLLQTEVMAAERARRKYKDLRLEMSMAALEHEDNTKHKRVSAEQAKAFETEMAVNQERLAALREDLLSANRVLVQAKTRVAAAIKEVLESEKAMHEEAIKSYQVTLSSMPNTPKAQVQG